MEFVWAENNHLFKYGGFFYESYELDFLSKKNLTIWVFDVYKYGHSGQRP